jgi:hypothetical protein
MPLRVRSLIPWAFRLATRLHCDEGAFRATLDRHYRLGFEAQLPVLGHVAVGSQDHQVRKRISSVAGPG